MRRIVRSREVIRSTLHSSASRSRSRSIEGRCASTPSTSSRENVGMSRPASCQPATTAPGACPVTSAWYRTSIAIRRASRRLPTSTLHTLEVLARSRVHLDALSLLDEQGDLDDGAGFELRGFHRSRSRVTLRSRIGLDDGEGDRSWELDGDGHALVHRDLRLAGLREVSRGVAHDLARHVHLVVRVLVHEHVLAAIGVQVLHRLALDDGEPDLHAGVEGLLDDGAGLDVAELRAHEGAALAGLHVLELDDLEQGSIEVEGHPVLQVVRGYAHTGSPSQLDQVTRGDPDDRASIVADLHHVLDPDPADPGEVDPGFDRDDGAFGELVLLGRSEPRLLVDLEADPMTQAVDEVVPIPR